MGNNTIDSKKIASNSMMISILALVSKLMGFLRVLFINWTFGQGAETDAYNAMLRITSVSIGLVASAIFTSLVPVLVKVQEEKGEKAKHEFFSNFSNICVLLGILIAVLVYVFAPQIISVMNIGYTGAKFDLAVKLTRMGTPIIVGLVLLNLSTGFLNSYSMYGSYSAMGIPFNLIYYVYLFFMPLSIEGLTIAAILASISQFVIQIPSIRKTGYRWEPLFDVKDPYISYASKLIIPVALGQSVQQISVIVDQSLASTLPDGYQTALDTASKFNDSIIAIFIAGMSIVVYPLLAEAFARNNKDRLVKIIDYGVNFVFLITIPATFGIAVLSNDIVRVIFEHRAFTAANTVVTAQSFLFYSIGLVGNGLRQLLSRVFYSLQDTKTPMKNGAVGVIVNVILNLILIGPMEHRGLALATSIGITVSTFLLFISLKRRLPDLALKNYAKEFTKLSLASVIMSIVAVFVKNRLFATTLNQLVSLGISVGLAALVYAISAILLRSQSGLEALELIKGKNRR